MRLLNRKWTNRSAPQIGKGGEGAKGLTKGGGKAAKVGAGETGNMD